MYSRNQGIGVDRRLSPWLPAARPHCRPDAAARPYLPPNAPAGTVAASRSIRSMWTLQSSQERAGSIDMTEAIRSPGSTLKPLIYAFAFENGIAHPETVLDDRPTHYGIYAPENFDHSFQGTVTARIVVERHRRQWSGQCVHEQAAADALAATWRAASAASESGCDRWPVAYQHNQFAA
jgi:Penicillin binding protein transpeptidase domain